MYPESLDIPVGRNMPDVILEVLGRAPHASFPRRGQSLA